MVQGRNRKLVARYDQFGRKVSTEGANSRLRKYNYPPPRNWTQWQGFGPGRITKKLANQPKG
jgi:hypothetical protein